MPREPVKHSFWWVCECFLEKISIWIYRLSKENHLQQYGWASNLEGLSRLQERLLLPTRLLCPWGFSWQEYWSWLPFPSPWDILTQWSNPWLVYCQESSLPLNQGSPYEAGGSSNLFFAWAGTPIFSCSQTLAFLILGTQTGPYTICSLGSQAFRLGLNYNNC